MESMDDHFAHSTLLPQEPASRRGPVVIAAALIVVLGVLATIFWRQLISIPSPFSSSRPAADAQEQQPPTLEEKIRLLGGSGASASTTSQTAVETAAKAALLEGKGGGTNSPAPTISAEDKAKLLGSQ